MGSCGHRRCGPRLEQLCVHALLVQLYGQYLLSVGEIPPAPGSKGFGGGGKKASSTSEDVKPLVWLGQDYQLQRQSGGSETAGSPSGSWQRGHWRALSPLVGPVAAPLEWVEPVLVG